MRENIPSDENRKEVFDRCPLLKIYLDDSYEVAINHWVVAMSINFLNLNKELYECVGESKMLENIVSLTKEGDALKVFADNVKEDTKNGFINIIMDIGYEAGNASDLSPFYDEIIDRSAALIKTLRDDVLSSEKGILTKAFFESVLLAGMEWKRMSTDIALGNITLESSPVLGADPKRLQVWEEYMEEHHPESK